MRPTMRGVVRGSVAAALGGALAGCSGGGGGGSTEAPQDPGPSVSLVSIQPVSGPAGGGTAITLTGTGFQSGATVTVGGGGALSIVVVSATTLTALTPPGAPGPSTVAVTNPDTTGATLAGGFTYVASPTLASVSPNVGPTGGGTLVTLSGSAFQAGATVAFGGSAATSISIPASTTIACVTPAGAAGSVAVTATNPDGQSSVLAGAFTFVPPPTLSSVSPSSGPSVGGSAVTLSGAGFQAGATAAFGGASATSVTVASTTAITCLSPAGSAGAVAVVVTNPDSQTAALAGGFTYVPPPTLSSVSPSSGTTAGGTAVTLSGSGFASGAAVAFGAGSATSVVWVSSTQITCATPAGTAGPVGVTVTNPDGQSGTLSAGFTYVAPLTLGSVAPAAVSTLGGTPITLTGTGFLAGATVLVGSSLATGVVVVSQTTITAITPAGTAGAASVTVTNASGPSSTLAGAVTYNAPPAITTTLGAGTRLRIGDTVTFSVTASDPEGDAVSLRLLNPPVGCVFAPLSGASPPATRTFHWVVHGETAGLQRLVFQASDSAVPTTRVNLAIPTQVLGIAARSPILTADVTGDGRLDAIGGASLADIGALDTGAIYVWSGATAPSGTPTAVLRVSGAAAGDGLGDAFGQTIQCADVTGDGTLDIVAGTRWADIGGTVNTGVVYVWAGGTTLTGTPSPTATLRVAGAVAGDALGMSNGQAIQCADVTGDGTLDVLAGAPGADIGGTVDAGAIYVWAGGSTLSGTVSPTATLRVSGATAGDRLSDAAGQGYQCADLTGDGTLDVVAGAQSADIGGTADTGAVYVWAGGSGLSGTLSPGATLRVSGAAASDRLGDGVGMGVQCADVSGDGTLDVVASASFADIGGTSDAGAIYVWSGGSGLTGTLSPTASLQVSGAVASDWLGRAVGQGILCQDVSGDGTLDIVAGAYWADIGGVANTGAIYVWTGGGGLTGTPASSATLRVAGAAIADRLGFASGQAIQCADVTADGTLDIVAGAQLADVGGTADTGAIYVWTGGSGLTGTLSPAATLRVPGATIADQLGDGSGHAIQCLDVTGDGTLDIVAGARSANVGGTTDTGAVYVWSGGSGLSGTLSPSATLRVPGAAASDVLGWTDFGDGIQCADVTGDGTLDILAATQYADVGATNTGAVYVWAGGSGLSGTLSPTATLRISGAANDDRLGYTAFGQAVQCADVTGDGTLDVVAGASLSNVGGTDTGAVFVWAGGTGLAGTLSPTATLRVSGAASSDQLGTTLGQGIQCADLMGDGIPDVLAGAEFADVGGTVDAGAISLWPGSATLGGTVSPAAIFAAPSPTTSDRLGR